MPKENILIVEDEHIVALVLKKQLEQYGFNVVDTVSSAKAAIRTAKETRPDLILMDIHLRGDKDGIDAVEEINKVIDVPVIFLTAYSDDKTIERVKVTSPASFLIKPVDEKELYTNVTIALYKHQLDKKLKEAELRYTSLFNHSLDSLYILDFDGRFIDANDRALGLLGYSKDEILNLNINDVVSEEQIVQAALEIEDLRNEKIRNGAGVFKLKHKDGSKIYVDTNYFLLYKDSQPYAVHAVARNITEKRRAEEALRRSEEKYRSFVQNSDDGIVLLNEAGQIIDWNRALVKITGLKAEETLGMFLWDLHPLLIWESEENKSDENKSEENKKGRDSAKQKMLNMLKTGIVAAIPPNSIVKIKTKAEETKSIESRIFPIKTAKGFMFGGIFRDITLILKSEADLKKSIELNKALFEGSVDPIIITDLNDVVLNSNKAFEKVFGYSTEELAGKTFPGHMGFDDGKFEEWIEQCRYGNGVAGFETVRRTKSGELIPVSISVSPIHSASGELVSLSLWYSNISSRKKAEEALRKSENEYHDLFLNAHEAMLILEPEDETVIEVNQRACELYGFSKDEFIGKSLMSISRNSDYGRRRVEEVLVTDKFISFETFQFKKNGSELNLLVTASLIDYKGKKAIMSLNQDITERKRIEKNLRESEQYYRLLFEDAPLGYQSLDYDGNIINVNNKWLDTIGYSKEEVIGRWLGEFMTPESREKIIQGFTQFRLQGRLSNVQYEMIRKDSGHIIASFDGRVVYDGNGEFRQIHCIMADITEQIKTQQNLKASEESYKRLTESIQDIFFELDNQLRYTYWNKASEKHLGITANQALGKSILQVFPDLEGSEILRNYRLVIEDKKPVAFETTIVINDSLYIFEISAYPSATGLSVIAKDITARKQAEEALKKSQLDYHSLVDSIDGIVWEFDLVNSRSTFVSKKTEKILGYPVEAWLNNPDFWYEHLYPENRDAVMAYSRRALEQNKTCDYQYRIVRSDGRIIWVRDIVVAVQENGDGVNKLRGIMIDITAYKDIEEELRKLSVAVEQNPTLIVITDTKGCIEYVNPKFSEVTGYSFEEAIGKNMSIIKSGETPDFVYKQLWAEITLGKVWKGEFKNKKKNGEVYWESSLISPLRDQDGRITHFVGVKEETTARKIVEKSLIESEDRYRRLVEMSPDAIVVYNNWIMVYVNEAAVKLFKAVSKDDLLGRNAIAFVHPEYRKEETKRVDTAISRGESVPFAEEKFLTLRGDVIDVEVGCVPTTYQGKPALQVIIRDIETRKKAEQALVLSEERFRTVFEKSPIGITISINAVLLQANKAYIKMFGFENPYELIGTSLLERITPVNETEKQSRVELKSKAIIVDGSYDTFGIRKDGSLFPVHVEIAHLNLSEGMTVMALISDITEIRNREEQIKNSLKEKEILLKEIHHRVKNNLQIISSLLSLQSEYIEDDKSLALFNDSRNRVRSMALIHERLYQSNDLARIDFSEYISELTGYLHRSYITTGKQVNIVVNADKVFLPIDAAIPGGLIINELVSNAFKYAFPGNRQGSVEITFKVGETGSVLLVVSDDGIGFPKGIDINNTVTLGFQLINNLVDQLGGTIKLDDSCGTKFIIQFSLNK